MLPPLATVAQMERRLGVAAGSLAGADLVRAEEALADASALVRLEADGTSWVADDGATITAPDAVVVVTLQSALRVYRNPDGYTGESVEGYSYQLGQATGSVDVYLSDTEKETIALALKVSAGAAGYTGSIGTPSAYRSTQSSDASIWGLE